ncbi:ArdC family protein [Geomonas agri]|uniref:ArdC family protein n=1 Tax=Geomonas agri TaxID=2873702 RepID=UPI001CD3B793|nr:zincin-like metallopeptidase domain-containing protein [Geomonas agri]
MGTDVYEVINSRIMELLERGTIPWRKTWNAGSSMPMNLISKKEYRGVNVFLLGCQEFGSQWWLTFKQVQDRGGHVKKGSRSVPVIFWKWVDRKDGDEPVGEGEQGNGGKVPLLRFYNVFNLEQTEGIEAPKTEEVSNTFTPIERAEQIVAGMPYRPGIKHGGGVAAYSPVLDYVKMPKPEAFDTPESYYDTLFHELSHSTGHSSRLGRKGILEPSYFGSHEYSKEELVAQIGASFLSGHAGIEHRTIENSAAYIAGWLKALKNDKTLLVHAAAQAQKAADYILNVSHQEDLTD